MTTDNDLLLTDEVAEITRIPANTLRWYRHAGRGPESYRLGSRVVYPRAALIEWMQQQKDATRRTA